MLRSCEFQLPILLNLEAASIEIICEVMTWRNAMHSLDNGILAGNVEQGHVIEQALRIDFPFDRRERQQRLQFGCKGKPAVGLPMIEWLDAHPVARSEKQIPPLIVQYKCEHPVEIFQQ